MAKPRDMSMRGRVTALIRAGLSRLFALPRPVKRVIMVGADLGTIPLALWSAITLRLGTFDHGPDVSLWLYVIAPLVSVPIFARLGLYRAVLRYMAGRAVTAIYAGVGGSVVATALLDKLVLVSVIPESSYVIYFMIAMLYVGGSRTLARHVFEVAAAPRDRVIIYGAGESGISLAIALKKNGGYRPVAFLDEDPVHQGTVLHGLEVFPPGMLRSLISRFNARRVLLALPGAPRTKRSAIIQELLALGLQVQTMPDLSDIVAGRAKVDELHDVDIADLLGRDPVPPRSDLLAACIAGKVVMVTGAGGSIGSELCRQIVRLHPERLVLVETSELALYNIERELRDACKADTSSPEIVSLLGTATLKQRMRDVMQTFAVNTVYHAAAYKHVPIVEQNVIQGIHNNIISTLHAAEAAADSGVQTFVLVSTDKAVNPTNVMGATKRMAELVLQALQQRASSTKFCMVRFGNVLDSSGSVVPLFREQIRRGGPVTVTHPDITRYFMTIPEAALLVIQAGSMACGGEVFVLDMGQPVRIADLAKRMIRLMGLTVRDKTNPKGDIAVEYTALRPGEKLYEELLLGDNVRRTEHPMILRAMEQSLPWQYVRKVLDELFAATDSFDARRAIGLLQQAVAEYRASSVLVDVVTTRRIKLGLEVDNVTELDSRRQTTAEPASTHHEPDQPFVTSAHVARRY